MAVWARRKGTALDASLGTVPLHARLPTSSDYDTVDARDGSEIGGHKWCTCQVYDHHDGHNGKQWLECVLDLLHTAVIPILQREDLSVCGLPVKLC